LAGVSGGLRTSVRGVAEGVAPAGVCTSISGDPSF
jgi:hypothetical protein